MFRIILLTVFVCLVASDQSRLESLRELLKEVRGLGEVKRGVFTPEEKDVLSVNYEMVRNENEPMMWCTVVYEGKTMKAGPTGVAFDTLLDELKGDSRVFAYVGLKCPSIDKPRFIFLTWIGPSVSPLKKAKVSTDKAFVKEIFVNFRKEILEDSINQVSLNKICPVLSAANGANYKTGA